MKFVTKVIACLAGCLSLASVGSAETLRETVLKDAAKDAGFVPASETHIFEKPDLVAIGQLLFESRLLSLNQDTACASCHLDQFGSADGLPISIGTEGEGIGTARVFNGGDIVPRNALPFWGRGGVGFEVFFWDGKVDGSSGQIVSQFGEQLPSIDPLVVAVHLPPAEIGEMVIDDDATKGLQQESVRTANQLYDTLAKRIRDAPLIGQALATAQGIQISDIRFLDVAEAIAAFIRTNFRVKQTKFHQFVFADGPLHDEELEGGLLFYGRGGCSQCHNGPYFSDMDFHAVPFPQLGFGRNGFGVDYGRFNVTLDEGDLYRFRTPPLYNVTKTAPYSHSGSVQELSDSITVHVDPLRSVDTQSMSTNERVEFYEHLKRWSLTPLRGVVLSEDDVAAIAAFLGTLNYESDSPVKVVD